MNDTLFNFLFMDPLILSGIMATAGSFLNGLFHKNKPKPQPNNTGNLLASAGINVGSSLLSNLLGSVFSRSNSRSLMSYQQMLQKQQQSWLWQNQYAQTVNGMRMAGLNPTMSAGQQSPLTATMPSATNNSYSPIDASAIAQLAQLSLLPSQQKINEATAANITADTANKNADTSNKGLQGELMSNELFTWFESWQNNQYLLGSQATANWKNAALAEKEIQKRDEEIKSIMENTKNTLELRQLIRSQIRLTNTQAEGLRKANARYDDYMDKVINRIDIDSTYMSHEDQRQQSMIIKRLVNLDFQNENLLYQQEYLQTMKDVQDWQLYLDRVYGSGDRFLNQVNTVLQGVQAGAKTAYLGSGSSIPFWQWPTH